MEEKIQKLYEEINFWGFQATYYRKSNYIQNIKALMPKVQEFVCWFIDQRQFGFGPEIYENLVDILKDCETALCQGDNVLMMDALEQGISGYLEIFLPEKYLEEKGAAYVGKSAGQEH